MLVFTDTVLNEICSGIAAHEPERGGALFGIRDTNVICHFAVDVDAKTTHATYLPSGALQEQVTAIEQQTSLIFRGIVHSHPGGMATPSGQDLVAFGKSLSDNLHLASFVAPIVTSAESKRPLEQHELALPVGSRMSTYIATRSSNRRPHVTESAVTVMPVEEHTTLLCSALTATKESSKLQRGYFSIGHVFYLTVTMWFRDIEVVALFPPIYPLAQPLVMISSSKHPTSFVDLPFGAEIGQSLTQPGWINRLAEIVKAMEGEHGT